MTNPTLTAQERSAFHQEITRNLALDYFYVFDNRPLQFLYKDKGVANELTELEQRNKTITETVWLDAYHQDLVCNIPFAFTYRGAVLQMPLQIHQVGGGTFNPPAEDPDRGQVSVAGFQANYDAWMSGDGANMVEKLRVQPPRASWQSLLEAPDRTSRIASIIPVGNQVILELISTWTVAGQLQETAWAVVLIYDVDGTVLQDRSYIEMSNWPSGPRFEQARAGAPETATVGIMDGFFEYQKGHQIEVTRTDLEKRSLAIIEGAWLEALNGNSDASVFHPERFRMQWPLQKCSFNLDVAREVAAESAGQYRLGLTYAKGSEVVVEGVVCWNEDGSEKESPFMSLLTLDEDGLVIRDRRYFTLGNWPGKAKVAGRLGL